MEQSACIYSNGPFKGNCLGVTFPFNFYHTCLEDLLELLTTGFGGKMAHSHPVQLKRSMAMKGICSNTFNSEHSGLTARIGTLKPLPQQHPSVTYIWCSI